MLAPFYQDLLLAFSSFLYSRTIARSEERRHTGFGPATLPSAYSCRGLQQNMHFSIPRSQESMHAWKLEQSRPGSTERHELVQTPSACTREARGIGTRKRTATPRSSRMRSINVIFIGFFSSFGLSCLVPMSFRPNMTALIGLALSLHGCADYRLPRRFAAHRCN